MKNRISFHSIGVIALFVLTLCTSKKQNYEAPTFPDTIPDNWLAYHVVHPGPGFADPGDPNPVWYYNGRYHMHYIYEIEEDGILRIKPLKGLEALRYNPFKLEKTIVTSEKDLPITDIKGDALEIEITFVAPLPEEFGIKMLSDKSDNNEVIILARANRKDIEIQEGSDDFLDVINPPFQLTENEDLTLRLYIDKTVVELFAKGRQAAAVFTFEYLRKHPNISIFTKDKDLTIKEIQAWKMKSIYEADLTFYEIYQDRLKNYIL